MNWNYLAGFFDGEGHTRATQYDRSWRFIWQITQRDETVIEEIANFLIENDFHPRLQPNREKYCMVLSIYRVGEVERILKKLRSLVIVKQNQIDNVLTAINNRPLRGTPEWKNARRKTRPEMYQRNKKGAKLG